MLATLRNLAPDEKAFQFFIRGAMRKAINPVKTTMVADAKGAGYPSAPGVRMTKGEKTSKPYKVWGRVPGAVRLGRYVAKRRDTGDTSQRVIVGQKLRGTSVGAPHANITRYSKNVNRKTKKGYNRGRFAAMPFVQQTLDKSQGALVNAFRREYYRYTRLVKRGR
jgi:hypothetical protein